MDDHSQQNDRSGARTKQRPKRAVAGSVAAVVVALVVVACAPDARELTDGTYLAHSEAYDAEGWAAFLRLDVANGEVANVLFERINRYDDFESDQAHRARELEAEGYLRPAEEMGLLERAIATDGSLDDGEIERGARLGSAFETLASAVLDRAADGNEETAAVSIEEIAPGDAAPAEPELVNSDVIRFAALEISESERARRARRGGLGEAQGETGSYAAVSNHRAATDAAMEVLEAGGTAADAAFVTASVLTVTEPWFSTVLGGGTWALYFDNATGEVRSLDGVAGAAAGATPEYFSRTERYGEYGMHLANVPGAWAGWMEWLAEYGEMSLTELLGPAISAAEDGVEVSPSMRGWLERGQANFRDWPDTAEIYLDDDGELLEAGDTYYLSDLANTFQRLANAYEERRSAGERAALEAAKDYFYRGPIAEEIVAFSDEHGGLYELSDFTEFDDAGFVDPISIEYDDLVVYQNPPNSQGITQLIALNILRGLRLGDYEPGSAESLHLQVEAIRSAAADRNRHVGDPDWVDVPVDRLLSEEHAQAHREGISVDVTREWPFPDPLAPAASAPNSAVVSAGTGAEPDAAGGSVDSDLLAHLSADKQSGPAGRASTAPEENREAHVSRDDEGHTTSFHIVDRYGNAAAVTTSLGAQFLVVGDTGIHINNRMRFMHYDEDDPNVTRPGKKVRHSSNPYMALRDGAPYLLGGNTGGDFQPQGQVQQFVNVVEYGMSAQEAVDQPRVEANNHPVTTYPFTARDRLGVEPAISEGAREGLRERGHNVEEGGVFGSANILRIVDLKLGDIDVGAESRLEVSSGRVGP